MLVAKGVLTEQTVGIDATTLEANAVAEGLENPTPEQLARLDRRRKKKTSKKAPDEG